MKGLQKRFRVDGSHVWYIDKRVRRYGRLCESTGTDNREEAERYLLHRLNELREVLIYGERPTRTFQDAIQKYESAFVKKKSIKRDSSVLQERVHDLRPPYLRPPPPGGRGHPRGPAGPAGPQGTGDHDALQRRRDRSPGGGGEPDSWGITRNFHAERKAGDRGVGVSGAKWLKVNGGKGGTRTLDPGIMSAVL